MFEKIYGHYQQKNILKNMLETGKISHSYLFFGKEGIGKKEIAFELAKELLEVSKLDTCVDFKYITKKEDKKDIIVNQIREEIIDDVISKPISGKRKVYIIDDAHYMNDIAQNALLKTLEEPPSYVVIIMIASNLNSFLPTILSRVNKIEFSGLNITEMNKYILDNGIKINDNIIEFAEGSIGKLQNIINGNYTDVFNKIYKVMTLIDQKDIAQTLISVQDIDFNNMIFLDYLEFILYKNEKFESCLEIKKARRRLKMNGNYDILIDNMLIRIIESM